MPRIACAAACAILVIFGSSCGSRTAASGGLATQTVSRLLQLKVVDLMEHEFRTEVTVHKDPIICSARVFGTDPAGAADATSIRRVYAWVYCQEEMPNGMVGDEVALPVAIQLSGAPTIEVPSSGDSYPTDIDRIFPADLRAIAINPPAYVGDLRSQVQASAQSAPKASPS